ncbi:transforming growth factor, beta 1a isoform X2 [Clinocottus analis]|uniref:transforming growth factor, beta 1a isoform X2 n=1 Tax=Clinocottus analis TaxID=304258 RepID=UPI0035BFAA21
MKLAFLALMAVYAVGNVSGMSTCKTLDLEMVKKKRIEAIRSQILSKLRLPKEPEPDQAGDEEEIPATLLSLYNSTKELLNEQQTKVLTDISTEQKEEEYFAKVLHKFNMTEKNDTETTKASKSIPMFFNISQIRESVGDYRLLTSAELRMLIKQTVIASEQRVELYQGLGASPRYLTSHFVTNEWKDKWLSFDVTKTLQNWLKGTEDEQGFQLRLFCECGQSGVDSSFSFAISGIETAAAASPRAKNAPQRQRTPAQTRRRPAAYNACTSISGKIWAGSGYISQQATTPITAWGPAPTSGMLKTNILRFWLCTSITTQEPLPSRAALLRRWSHCQSSTMWAGNTRWSSCPI